MIKRDTQSRLDRFVGSSDFEGIALSSYKTAELKTLSQFSQNQQVSFIGGMGKIKSCRFDGRQWICTIEMELAPEPDIGRIGSETTILMHETDLVAVAR